MGFSQAGRRRQPPGPEVPEPEGVRLAWQPCNPIPRKRDVGRRLCAPSFRTVCPFQARLIIIRHGMRKTLAEGKSCKPAAAQSQDRFNWGMVRLLLISTVETYSGASLQRLM